MAHTIMQHIHSHHHHLFVLSVQYKWLEHHQHHYSIKTKCVKMPTKHCIEPLKKVLFLQIFCTLCTLTFLIFYYKRLLFLECFVNFQFWCNNYADHFDVFICIGIGLSAISNHLNILREGLSKSSGIISRNNVMHFILWLHFKCIQLSWNCQYYILLSILNAQQSV